MHNDRPVVGMKLPQGYTVQNVLLRNGKRFRAAGYGWMGPVRHTPLMATDDAWDHFYISHGAKPRLRVHHEWVTDIITGHTVLHRDVKQAGSYAGAFRLRAERMRVMGDVCSFQHMTNKLNKIADTFEEIAQRLEVRRVHD